MPDPSSLLIADFEATRLDELVALWRASFEAGVGVAEPHSVAEQRQYFVDQVLPQHEVRVALAAGRCVGFIAATPDTVAQLYVHVGWQRQGIGKILLDSAKARSSRSLRLYTFARNLGARAFYESQGFVIEAEGFEPSWQLEDVRYRWTAATE